MRIAVLSGKGGAGKTFVSTNLAATLKGSTYMDCDVEEPNGAIFLHPENIRRETVSTQVPVFDDTRCTGCRKCVSMCRFNALICIKKKMMVFTEVCHSCGLCSLVCPEGAISENDREIGHVSYGTAGDVSFVEGRLNEGESSGIKVINGTIDRGMSFESEFNIIDCPPGSACPVMESVEHSDVCLLVAEETAFGFHNFRMVHELCRVLNKPCMVVINKSDADYPDLMEYCQKEGLEVIARIPFRKEISALCAKGKLAVREDDEMRDIFSSIADRLREEK